MALPDCAPPASSNIANSPSPESTAFDENRLRIAKPIFVFVEDSPDPLTFVNHIETIP
jgi:hypothetical protein